jgi:hypothetical protein
MTARRSPLQDPSDGLADGFGTVHRTDSRDALAAFSRAVEAVLAHRPTALAAIERALACDPDLVPRVIESERPL